MRTSNQGLVDRNGKDIPKANRLQISMPEIHYLFTYFYLSVCLCVSVRLSACIYTYIHNSYIHTYIHKERKKKMVDNIIK